MNSPLKSLTLFLLGPIFISTTLLLSLTQAEAKSLVLPADFKVIEGNNAEGTALGFFSNTAQIVYGASLVGGAGINIGDRISGLAFRVDGPSTSPAWSVSDFQIRLATSLNGPGNLDPNFINNRGADYTVVRSGPLAYAGTEYPEGGSPNGFGPVISFSTSFIYKGGDLLLEYTHSTIADGGGFADAGSRAGFLAQSQFAAGFDSTMESFSGQGLNKATIVKFQIHETTLDDCDNAFVDLANKELIIEVTPTGIDDTANIQCALDAAANIGIPIVSLSAGDFFIRNIFVEKFYGSLQGTTRTSTRLNILDNSIDCRLLKDQGLSPSAVRFSQGEPQLKFMQILANSPCMTDVPLDSVIHFTGKNAYDPDCGFSVINGRVDRVDVVGPGAGGNVNVGIAATAESEIVGGCNIALLGGFKLNKSSISSFTRGLQTGMRSGAQVDINFSVFDQNQYGVVLMDSNQSTTVTTNEFFSDDPGADASFDNGLLYDTTAIWVTTSLAKPPSKTRLIVDNNKFNIHSSTVGIIDAIRAGDWLGNPQVISLAITNNVFDLTGSDTIGIWTIDVDNGAISANRFKGNGGTAIGVIARLESVTGTTITANQGFAGFNALNSDIFIGLGVLDTIIGPGQNAVVNDLGSNSVILSK